MLDFKLKTVPAPTRAVATWLKIGEFHFAVKIEWAEFVRAAGRDCNVRSCFSKIAFSRFDFEKYAG
jgi:hypothetical protein